MRFNAPDSEYVAPVQFFNQTHATVVKRFLAAVPTSPHKALCTSLSPNPSSVTVDIGLRISMRFFFKQHAQRILSDG